VAASIINGKGIAQEIRSEVKAEIEILKESRGLTPGLAVVLIGNDPASAIYVKNKEVACEEVGISTRTFHLPTDVSEEQVVELITSLNKSGLYHGILTQLPFPPHINDSNVIDHLDPAKDVDGLHPYNFGLLAAGTPRFIAATP